MYSAHAINIHKLPFTSSANGHSEALKGQSNDWGSLSDSLLIYCPLK